jgi:hypothetical protein
MADAKRMTEAVKLREKIHTDAVQLRDALLNAKIALPQLISQANEIVEISSPPKGQQSLPTEDQK